MTTPINDVKALIDELGYCAMAPHGENDHAPKLQIGLLLKARHALERYHAIVERVTKLYEEGELNGHHVYTSELIKALNPPAEQPPRSEPEMCGEYYFWGTSKGCPQTKGHEGSHGPLGNTQYARVRSEPQAVAKCGEWYTCHAAHFGYTGTRIQRTHAHQCNGPKRHVFGHYFEPAAQPKPSPDRSAMKCGRLIVSDRLCNNSAGHDGDCSYVAPPDEDGEAESLKRHIANAEAYYEALERQIDTKPNRSEARCRYCHKGPNECWHLKHEPEVYAMPLAPHEIDNGEAQSKARDERIKLLRQGLRDVQGYLRHEFRGLHLGRIDDVLEEDDRLAAAKTPEGSAGRGDV